MFLRYRNNALFAAYRNYRKKYPLSGYFCGIAAAVENLFCGS
jgi:hypothetical protein